MSSIKREKKKNTLLGKSLMHSMFVSVIGIFVCVVALCTATWAWYSENISSSSNSVYSANCNMIVSVQQLDGENYLDVEKNDGMYELRRGAVYRICLTSYGTASSAYAVIYFDGTPYFTEQLYVFDGIDTAQDFIFTVSFSQNVSDQSASGQNASTPSIAMEILPCWGTSSRVYRDIFDGEAYLDLCKVTGPLTQAPITTVVPATTAPLTAQAPITTAPLTTQYPSTNVPETTVVPIATAPQTTELPVITVPETTEIPATTAPLTTQMPETTAPQTIESPVITVPETTEIPATTAPLTTQMPETTAPQTIESPVITVPETTEAPATTELETTEVPVTTAIPITSQEGAVV